MLEERITTRVPKHVKEKLQRAADIEGATLNQFIVHCALQKAVEIIERENRIQLSVEDTRTFYQTLDNPPPPTTRLMRAIKRYQTMKRGRKPSKG